MSHRLTSAVLAAASLTLAATSAAQVQNESQLGWAVTNQVFDLARVDNTVYVAGAVFNGLALGNGGDEPFALIDATTGIPSATGFMLDTPEDNSVNAVVGDGGTGWYAGGTFTRVGPNPRSGLAHLTRTGLDPAFAPSPNGGVNAMLRDGNTLYVAGFFTSVNGQARGGGAAFDLTTGALLPWNPQLDAQPGARAASAIAKSGSTVFLGGSFTMASGTSRQGLAAVDATTGALLPAPAATLNAGGTVSTLLLSGNTLYVGGAFSTIGGVSRLNLASIDATTGAVTTFPETNGTVRALVLDGTTLYVGGGITQLGGQPRSGVGRIDTATGVVDAWTANTNGPVFTLLLMGTTVYVGGGFSMVGGQPRVGVAAVSKATAAPLAWNPGLGGGTVNALVAAGANEFVVAGSFNYFGAVARPGIAAIDLVTNEPQPPFVSVNGNVRSITVVGNTLYLSGQFTVVNGQSRNGFAAVDRHSGELRPWNPNATGSITNQFGAVGGRSVVVVGNTAFIGGYFTSIGGLPRSGFAQVDATTGAATPFVADAIGGGVHKLVRDGQTLYVGGTFTSIGGQVRQSLAAYDLAPATPALLPLAVPLAGSTPTVNAMKVVGSTLYVGGAFSFSGYFNAVALTMPGGAPTLFRPGVGGQVFDIDVLGGTAYLAGNFSTVNGVPRRAFAAVDAATGQNRAFDPNNGPGTGMRVVASPEGLIAGGNVNGDHLQFFPTTGLGGLPGRPTAPFALLPPPGLPVSLFIVWEEPTLGGPVTGYRLEVGSGPGRSDIATLPTADEYFDYSGVVPPGLYYARVRAVGPSGVGPASPEIAFAGGVAGCVGIAHGLLPMSTVNGPDVTVSWFDPPFFPGSLSYSLDVGTASGTNNIGTIAVGAANQISATAPPGAYFVKLRGRGPCGIPAPSSEHLVSVGGVLPLDAPVLSAQVSGNNVSLNVTPVNGASGYLLDAGFGPLHSFLRVPMAGTGFNAAAPPGTYYVRAYAVGGPTGLSRASNEVVVVVP